MQSTTLSTTWTIVDDRLEPDLSAEPPSPPGYYRSGVAAPVSAGHTPESGEAVTVTLSYAELPPPPPDPAPDSPTPTEPQ